MALGLRFKDQLPAGPIRDEFEQLVGALNIELETLRTVETVEVTNFIVSVQEVEIAIAAGNASATATLTIPVDPRYTDVSLQGFLVGNGGGFPDGAGWAYISALTATTITATRDLAYGGSGATVRVQLIQYRASVMRQSVQLGVINLAAALSATASVVALGPKAIVRCTGFSQNTAGAANDDSCIGCKVEKTSANVITGTRASNATGTAHVGYCAVDFN